MGMGEGEMDGAKLPGEEWNGVGEAAYLATMGCNRSYPPFWKQLSYYSFSPWTCASKIAGLSNPVVDWKAHENVMGFKFSFSLEAFKSTVEYSTLFHLPAQLHQ